MKCALCGYDYDETQAQAACAKCMMAKHCRLVRCPNCGYETPAEPAWLKRLFDRRQRDDPDGKS